MHDDLPLAVRGGGVTGEGVIDMAGGTFALENTGDFGGSSDWSFDNLTFGDGLASTETTTAGVGRISVSGTLTIADKHTLNAGNNSWTLSGSQDPFVFDETFGWSG